MSTRKIGLLTLSLLVANPQIGVANPVMDKLSSAWDCLKKPFSRSQEICPDMEMGPLNWPKSTDEFKALSQEEKERLLSNTDYQPENKSPFFVKWDGLKLPGMALITLGTVYLLRNPIVSWLAFGAGENLENNPYSSLANDTMNAFNTTESTLPFFEPFNFCDNATWEVLVEALQANVTALYNTMTHLTIDNQQLSRLLNRTQDENDILEAQNQDLTRSLDICRKEQGLTPDQEASLSSLYLSCTDQTRIVVQRILNFLQAAGIPNLITTDGWNRTLEAFASSYRECGNLSQNRSSRYYNPALHTCLLDDLEENRQDVFALVTNNKSAGEQFNALMKILSELKNYRSIQAVQDALARIIP